MQKFNKHGIPVIQSDHAKNNRSSSHTLNVLLIKSEQNVEAFMYCEAGKAELFNSFEGRIYYSVFQRLKFLLDKISPDELIKYEEIQRENPEKRLPYKYPHGNKLVRLIKKLLDNGVINKTGAKTSDDCLFDIARLKHNREIADYDSARSIDKDSFREDCQKAKQIFKFLEKLEVKA